MQESRQYSSLAFCAFKNHTQCFSLIYEHGCKYNLPLTSEKKPTNSSLQNWANKPTDEKFTALHLATYHGNFDLIRTLVEEMEADIFASNVYGANVLHISAQGD